MLDFRALNEQMEQRHCPLPKIMDIMNRRGKYKHFTKIDLSMMYYCFELDEESKKLCTIITEFGAFQYTRMPMGVSISPFYAQQYIEQILKDIPEAEVYIDDVGLWSNGDYADHLKLIDKVLKTIVFIDS